MLEAAPRTQELSNNPRPNLTLPVPRFPQARHPRLLELPPTPSETTPSDAALTSFNFSGFVVVCGGFLFVY